MAYTHRNTLYGILSQNNYTTSFSYGGNMTLAGFDRFTAQEKVDVIIDSNSFGTKVEKQAEDAAGNTLGYPDHELFARYQKEEKDLRPTFDILFTQSTKAPYSIPKAAAYLDSVEIRLGAQGYQGRKARIVENHKAVFASFLYTDNSLAKFMAKEAESRNMGIPCIFSRAVMEI